MRRIISVVVGIVLLLLGVGALLVFDKVNTLESERVTDDVSVLFGLGGNVGVLRTEVGAVVVDSMSFAMQGRAIRALAERLAAGPVQALVNTHYHTDHTHGNPGFAAGTRVIATNRTRDFLHFFDADYKRARPRRRFRTTRSTSATSCGSAARRSASSIPGAAIPRATWSYCSSRTA